MVFCLFFLKQWLVFRAHGFQVPINRSPRKTRPSDWNWLLPDVGSSARNIGTFAGNPNISVKLIERQLFGNRRHDAECLPRITVQHLEATPGSTP